ncbi:MAG: prephenate dehydratase domain-containing protein, partial [Verrucomicrobiota bacterium]
LSLRIHLSLLTRSKSTKISKIYSHFVPLNHCRKWLAQHYPGIPTLTTTSTSEAARLAQEHSGIAALAGSHAAKRYGLEFAVKRVAPEIENQTWFFVIGKPLKKTTQGTHTTLILELPHKPGALARFLLTLSKNNLNLTRIESRPIPGQFKHYRFVIEFEGDPLSPQGIQTLKIARKHAAFLQVMGHYPYRHFESL